MDYNTQREKLMMPEYGRYVQKMLKQIKSIPDKEKRSEQVRAVVNTMGILNPHLREMNDFSHKLWDHLYVISDFDLDINSPYPPPTSESFYTDPSPIELEASPLRVNYYGRHIQNLAEALGQRQPSEERDEMVMALAYYMRKQYLIWNKDIVSDETIFNDMVMLSNGRITIPEGAKLAEVQGEAIRQSYFQSRNGQQRGGLNPNGFQRNKKRRKKPKQ
ncbi:MAG: DUF4290 domain-containing protein [Prevotellaceae bacterium]|jgi:hypothetical protein|nr:DUF4290 domain-containing protein [Prevotellaceae bacterium]